MPTTKSNTLEQRLAEMFKSIARIRKGHQDAFGEFHHTLQPYHDLFLAAKHAGVISKYDVRTGEVTFCEEETE